jgi:cell fate (sporulation/competence/biofilm development) regulator YmcA (YheA/YmcA/DUF963 family)
MSIIKEDHGILTLAKNITERLQSTAEVKRFQLAEKQIQESNTVQTYIETIKEKQKELVHAKHYQKKEYISLLERELDQIQHEFENLPIVKEYQQSQVEINNFLQNVQQILLEILSPKISVETGGKVNHGCGGNIL